MSKLLPLVFFLLLALILGSLLMPAGWPGHMRPREAARKSACMSKMKQLARALQLYAQDADDRLPPTSVWSDVVETTLRKPEDPPRVERSGLFRCPSIVSQGLTDSYAMNRALSGDVIPIGAQAAGAVLLFESNLSRPNAAGSAADLAHPERHPSSSGSGGRHPVTRGNNFAFLDGHVKWYDNAPVFDPPGVTPSTGKAAPKP